MENPFRYGSIVTGEYFTDRVDESNELIADLMAGQDVVLVGPRRYGKTSLMLQVLDVVRKEGLLVAYLDLQRAPSRKLLADRLSTALYHGIASPHGRLVRWVTDLFNTALRVRPVISLDDAGHPSLSFDVQDRSPQLDALLEGLYALPQRVAEERGKKVVLVLDEFQYVLDLGEDMLGPMRSAFQGQRNVTHVFLGSIRHMMMGLFADPAKPMYKIGKMTTLGPLKAGAWHEFIRDRFSSTGLMIDGEAVATIPSITEGHPQDTQQLCFFVWSEACREGRATSETVTRALETIIDAENARYTYVWQELSPQQRALLLALVRYGGKNIYSQEYRRLAAQPAPPSIARAVSRLDEKELIELCGPSEYRITDAFFQHWIWQRIILE